MEVFANSKVPTACLLLVVLVLVLLTAIGYRTTFERASVVALDLGCFVLERIAVAL